MRNRDNELQAAIDRALDATKDISMALSRAAAGLASTLVIHKANIDATEADNHTPEEVARLVAISAEAVPRVLTAIHAHSNNAAVAALGELAGVEREDVNVESVAVDMKDTAQKLAAVLSAPETSLAGHLAGTAGIIAACAGALSNLADLYNGRKAGREMDEAQEELEGIINAVTNGTGEPDSDGERS